MIKLPKYLNRNATHTRTQRMYKHASVTISVLPKNTPPPPDWPTHMFSDKYVKFISCCRHLMALLIIIMSNCIHVRNWSYRMDVLLSTAYFTMKPLLELLYRP